MKEICKKESPLFEVRDRDTIFLVCIGLSQEKSFLDGCCDFSYILANRERRDTPARGAGLTTVDTFFNKKRQITHFPFEAVCFTVDTSDITIDQHICMSTERSSLHLPVADWSLLVQI